MISRLCLLFAVLFTLSAAAAPKPNVVVMLADDSGWGDYSIQGNTNLKTPNIDTLAKSGASFDRFFVCALCAPTRGEFLTGRYHSRGGVKGVSTGLERLNTDEKTIADSFLASGYATGAFGKWHNGSQWPYHPNARGFQEYVGYTAGHWGEYFDPPLEHNGKWFRGKGFIVDILVGKAMEFIETNKEKQFFCYIPLTTPHSPFSVPDEHWNKFKDSPVTMRGEEGEKEDLAVSRTVLAMMDNIDLNVGRVLKKLDDLKLSDNTIVVYFSDNGPNSFRWNGGMKGKKGTTDEGGVRSVLFVRWPGKIQPGTTVPHIAGAIDLLPTLTEMAGVTSVSTKPLDGRSFSSLLLGAKWEAVERVLMNYNGGKLSVRSQTHRLDAAGGLFDMVTDPNQKVNIAKEKPEVAAELAKAGVKWHEEIFGKPYAFESGAKAKGKGKGKGGATIEDDRPYPVGYAEFPITMLPARDGLPHGEIKRSSGAPNCSYFVNWKTKEDSMTWDIDIHTAGDYDVTIDYACPEADAGATVELRFGEAKTTGKVTPGWYPRLLDDQDRASRKGESYMRDFHTLTLGTISLPANRGLLTLRALDIPGQTVMEVRRVNLTLKTK
ncbi:arylsulfatase [Prosthecobacter sp.]|uniref:arylsulfatase n=1 Tax=Prosthecobacter sp. TaxID=1965333 RepID=UPI001DF3499F|nr:arylsulfatase [Prosthecobacter sp.]MCB1275805.1 arylsulfatase [Prosthecobacter sp.]